MFLRNNIRENKYHGWNINATRIVSIIDTFCIMIHFMKRYLPVVNYTTVEYVQTE